MADQPVEVHDTAATAEAPLSKSEHLAMGDAHTEAGHANHLAAQEHYHAAAASADGSPDTAPDSSADSPSDSGDSGSTRGMSRLTAIGAQARALPARGTLNHQTHAALRGRR